jgi:hypothetical protein
MSAQIPPQANHLLATPISGLGHHQDTDIPLEAHETSGKDLESSIPTTDARETSLELGGEAEEEDKDVIPNGGYGWVNVACVVVQNSVTWGMSLVYSISFSVLPPFSSCFRRSMCILIIRCEYILWRLLGILPPEQSFRRRLDIQVRLGRGFMCRCSFIHRTGSEYAS